MSRPMPSSALSPGIQLPFNPTQSGAESHNAGAAPRATDGTPARSPFAEQLAQRSQALVQAPPGRETPAPKERQATGVGANGPRRTTTESAAPTATAQADDAADGPSNAARQPASEPSSAQPASNPSHLGNRTATPRPTSQTVAAADRDRTGLDRADLDTGTDAPVGRDAVPDAGTPPVAGANNAIDATGGALAGTPVPDPASNPLAAWIAGWSPRDGALPAGPLSAPATDSPAAGTALQATGAPTSVTARQATGLPTAAALAAPMSLQPFGSEPSLPSLLPADAVSKEGRAAAPRLAGMATTRTAAGGSSVGVEAAARTKLAAAGREEDAEAVREAGTADSASAALPVSSSTDGTTPLPTAAQAPMPNPTPTRPPESPLTPLSTSGPVAWRIDASPSGAEQPKVPTTTSAGPAAQGLRQELPSAAEAGSAGGRDTDRSNATSPVATASPSVEAAPVSERDPAGRFDAGAGGAPSFSHLLDAAAQVQAHAANGSGLGTAATAAAVPTDVTLPTPVLAPEFREALGVQVSVLARDGVQHAELHLNPTDMGPISVRIAIDGTQAQVDFGVDSATTRALVESGLPELASALREAGLTLSGGGVSQHARGQAGDSQAGRSGDGAAANGRQPPVVDSRDDGREDPPRPRTVRVAGGIDVYA